MSLNNADEYRDWSEIENKLRFHLQYESCEMSQTKSQNGLKTRKSSTIKFETVLYMF